MSTVLVTHSLKIEAMYIIIGYFVIGLGFILGTLYLLHEREQAKGQLLYPEIKLFAATECEMTFPTITQEDLERAMEDLHEILDDIRFDQI